MIVGLGVDLAEIERFASAQSRNANFAKKVLTPNELIYFEQYSQKRSIEFLAGRYAVKEAFSKAYGTGIGPIGFQDLETLNDRHGKPYIQQTIFDGTVHVSLSHTTTMVIAEVILERG